MGTEWVVLASWTDEGGETHCQVMRDGIPSETLAAFQAGQVSQLLSGDGVDYLVESCTAVEAEAVVTE